MIYGAIALGDMVYVADTMNNRVQIFRPRAAEGERHGS
jgi:hypothetical protein